MGRTLTPTTLLSLPRPGTPLVNPARTLALWPSSSYSFETQRTTKSLFLVDIAASAAASNAARPPKLLKDDVAFTDVAWLDDRTIARLRYPASKAQQAVSESGEAGCDHGDFAACKTDDDVSKVRKQSADAGVEVWALDTLDGKESKVLELPVMIADLKAVQLDKSTTILAFSASVYADGDIYAVPGKKAQIDADARGSSVRVYDSTFVRHWDTWLPTHGEKKQLHFVKLSKGLKSDDGFEIVDHEEEAWRAVTKAEVEGVETTSSDESTMFKPNVWSPMAGTPLECPVGPFGGTGDFDLSASTLVFMSKSPHVNPAWHTACSVYACSLSPATKAQGQPREISVGGRGATSSPVITQSNGGKHERVAWLEMAQDGYEADRNEIVGYELSSDSRWAVRYPGGYEQSWDRSPGTIAWKQDGRSLWLLAEEHGREKLFDTAEIPDNRSGVVTIDPPRKLTDEGSIGAFFELAHDEVLLARACLTCPTRLELLDVRAAASVDAQKKHKSAISTLALLAPRDLRDELGLSPGHDFWFDGTKGNRVHGFALFPPGFQQGQEKKWPLAFLVHGGPQSAWTDSWSTRWNPNSYAAAGYITVMINPTGSTGYGQKFTDDIQCQWGGRPFDDLVLGLRHVKSAFPEIDPERMAMLGASYGGYMANWVQGHNDQMGFKAIVCHDGVFSTSATWYATEEIYFPEREHAGTPWQAPEEYERWNPQRFIKQWRTPQLVIHGGKDFRLTESEGLGVFNTLQRLGIPSRLVYFEEENHWVLKPANSLRWHEEVIKWIDEWTSIVEK